jgi:hypothetical protein
MAESALSWMKKFESPLKGYSQISGKIIPMSDNDSFVKQTKLDLFLTNPSSSLFDKEFTEEDFQAVTRKWKQENLVSQES